MNSYVYLFCDVDGTPIYVGKGTKKRWQRHYTSDTHLGRLLKKRCREGMILNPIISSYMTPEDAISLEKVLIKFFGRADQRTGTLLNLTDGGEGAVNMSDETKKKLSIIAKGRVWSETSRAKLSESCKGRVFTPEHRLKLKQAKA